MPINNYTAPASTISQFVAKSVAGTSDRSNVLVIGPQYEVQTYDPAVTLASSGLAYLTAGVTLPLSTFEADDKLDAAYTRLFARDLRFQVAAIDGTAASHFSPVSLDDASVVALYTNSGNTTTASVAGTGLFSGFHGRSLQVGDILKFTHPSGTSSRKVAALLGTPIAAAVPGTSTNSASNPAASAAGFTQVQGNADFGISASGTFSDPANRPLINGFYGDRFTISVNTPGAPGVATVNVRSNSGLYDAVNVATTDSSGDFVISGTYAGQTFTIEKNAARTALVASDVFIGDGKGAYGVSSFTRDSSAAAFTGGKDTTYIVRITTSGANGAAVASVTDTAGIDTPQTITITGSTQALGSFGVYVTFGVPTPQTQWLKGDVYTFPITAATRSTTAFNTVRLDGPAYPTSAYPGILVPTTAAMAATAQVSYTGEIAAKDSQDFVYTFTTGETAADGVAVRSALSRKITGLNSGFEWAPAVNGTGLLFLTARGLVPPVQGDSYFEVATQDDNINLLGASVPDNDLGYAVSIALTASAKRVFFLRVASDDAQGYADALTLAERADIFYVLVPTADANLVAQVLKTHVDTMSSPTQKKWRQAFLNTASPAAFGVLTGDNLGEITTVAGRNVRLRQEGGEFNSLNLRKGDIVRINYGTDGWGSTTYESYPILTVVSDEEITLQNGPVAPTGAAIHFEIWKTDSADSAVDYLTTLAASIGDRRICLVWVDNPLILSGTSFADQRQFAPAAEAAGYRAASLPHQGLTRTAITSVAAAPTMYTKFRQQQLDTIAASGVFIVTQDINGGLVYIRHQLTTDVSNGPLYYENSATSNIDNLCYQYKDPVEAYTGKWNSTPTAVSLIRNDINNITLGAALTVNNPQLGPQIIAFDDTFGHANTCFVQINQTNKDRIEVRVRWQIPLPLNGVDVYTYADTIQLTSATPVVVQPIANA